MTYHYTIIDLKVASIPVKLEAILWVETILSTLGLRILSRTDADYPSPQNAYTIAWILAESHAILHTAPEKSWIELVIATCSGRIDHGLFVDLARRRFNPISSHVLEFEAGLP